MLRVSGHTSTASPSSLVWPFQKHNQMLLLLMPITKCVIKRSCIIVWKPGLKSVAVAASLTYLSRRPGSSPQSTTICLQSLWACTAWLCNRPTVINQVTYKTPRIPVFRQISTVYPGCYHPTFSSHFRGYPEWHIHTHVHAHKQC